jgi:hypothetical protein
MPSRLWLLLALTLVACSSPGTWAAFASLPTAPQQRLSIPANGISKAYTFLDLMMDKYATGSTTRLVQSFDGGGSFTDATILCTTVGCAPRTRPSR